jgi:outer membrane protein assembly factor BamB/orotate phosphoribosyltransferase
MLDCREIALAPDVLPALGRLLYDAIAPLGPRAVAGTGVSGAPLVTAVVLESARVGKPLAGLLVRERRKPYGRRRQIEGSLPPAGTPVAVVDDIVSSGATVDALVEALSRHGLRPAVVATIVEFRSPQRGRTGRGDVPHRHLFTLQELGIAEPDRPLIQPAVRWRYGNVNRAGDGVPVSRPTRNGDLVVFGSNRGWLHALDVAGQPRWRVPLGDPASPAPTHCTPLFTRHGIVIGCDNGTIHCVERDTGQLVWSTQCSDRIGAGLVEDGTGHIVVPATRLPHDGELLWVDGSDGRVSARRPLSGYAHARPTATSRQIIGADNSGRVTAFAVSDDRVQQWQQRLGAAVKADVVADETGTCYVVDFDGLLSAIDASGVVRWRRRLARYLYSAPLVAGEYVHVAGDGHLFAVERAGGRLAWVTAIGPDARGAIARLPDGTLVAGCGDGSVRLVSAVGAPLAAFHTGGPVTSGATCLSVDSILVSSSDGTVYALEAHLPR